MIASDFGPFLDAWLRLAENFDKRPSDGAVRDVFATLADLEFAEVGAAMRAHLRDGDFMARPRNIRLLVCGELPTDTVLRSLAIKGATPLGVKLRELVGHHLMTTGDENAVFYRVQSVRPDAAEFFSRTGTGEFTDDEIRRCTAAGTDPCGELAPGVPGPRVPFREALAARVRTLTAQARLPAGTAPIMRDDGTARDLTDEERARAEIARADVLASLGIRRPSPAREAVRTASVQRAELEAAR